MVIDYKTPGHVRVLWRANLRDVHISAQQRLTWQEAQTSYIPWRADDNENYYDLSTTGGLNFIAVHLGFDVTQEELDRASNAMVMTHAHRKPSTNPDGCGAVFSPRWLPRGSRSPATTR